MRLQAIEPQIRFEPLPPSEPPLPPEADKQWQSVPAGQRQELFPVLDYRYTWSSAPLLADPTDAAWTAPAEISLDKTSDNKFGSLQAAEATPVTGAWQSLRSVFSDTLITPDGSIIANPTRAERLDVAIRAIGAPAAYLYARYFTGRMYQLPRLVYAGLNRLIPEAFNEPKDFSDAVLDALEYQPGEFVKSIGYLSDFVGSLRAASPASLPKSLNLLHKMGDDVLRNAAAIEMQELAKRAAQAVSPNAPQETMTAGQAADMLLWTSGFSALFSSAAAFFKSPLGTQMQFYLLSKIGKYLVDHPNVSKWVLPSQMSRQQEELYAGLHKILQQQGIDTSNLSYEQRAALAVSAKLGTRLMRLHRQLFQDEDIIKASKPASGVSAQTALSAEPVFTASHSAAMQALGYTDDVIWSTPTSEAKRIVESGILAESSKKIQQAAKSAEAETVPFAVPEGLSKYKGSSPVFNDFVDDLTADIQGFAARLGESPKNIRELWNVSVRNYINHLKDNCGQTGKKVYEDFNSIQHKANILYSQVAGGLDEAYKGMNTEQRRQIGMVCNGLMEAASPDIQRRADTLRNALDKLMEEAQAVGLKRQGKFGKMEIKGSGRAYPAIPNKQGWEFLEEASRKGLSSARVMEFAQKQVQEGRAKSAEDALAQLHRYRQQQIARKSAYLTEVIQSPLPPEMLEFDGAKVLYNWAEKQVVNLEFIRQYGQPEGLAGEASIQLPKLHKLAEELSTQFGTDEGERLLRFTKAVLGQPLGEPEVIGKMAADVRYYQAASKVAINPLSIIANMLDRFTKGLVIGDVASNLKAIRAYPPILNIWMKSAREIEHWAVQNGAVFVHGSSLAEHYTGTGLMSWLSKGFREADFGNQVFYALVRYIDLQKSVKAFMEHPQTSSRLFGSIQKLIEGIQKNAQKGRVSAVMETLTEAEAAQMRDVLSTGESIPPEIMAKILYNTVKDTAFVPSIASAKPYLGAVSSMYGVLTQFKTWSVSQARHIWEDVVKHAIKYKDPTVITRFLLGVFIVGEIRNIVIDIIRGRNRSLASVLTKEDKTAGDIARAILRDLASGGAVAFMVDIAYGLPDFISGPTFKTLKNIMDAAAEIAWHPSQIDDAIANLAFNEVAVLRDMRALADKLDSRSNKANLTQVYYPIRQAAKDWAYNKEYASAADKTRAKITEVLQGNAEPYVTGNKLSYDLIYRQVLVGDADDAAEHIAFLLRNSKDIDETLTGIKRSLRQRSPLGPISQNDLPAYLQQMTPEERQKALDAQQQWEQTAQKAVLEAVRIFRRRAGKKEDTQSQQLN